MHTTTFSAGRESFEFTFYESHGQRLATANVKARALRGKLPPGYEEKATKIDRERAWDLAFQSCVELWWDDHRDQAGRLGLGDVFSVGRSGGWIVLPRFTENYIQSLCESVEWLCAHCDKPYAEHGKGKCLFDSTFFEPRSKEGLEALRNASTFLDECAASVRGAAAEKHFTEELMYWIDTLLEEKT